MEFGVSTTVPQLSHWYTHGTERGWAHTRIGIDSPPFTQTADFSKLYTMLSKTDIRTAVKFWIRMIFARKPGGNWGLKFSLDKATLRYVVSWHMLVKNPVPLSPPSPTNTRNNTKNLILGANDFLALIEFYLEHTYMWFNGTIAHGIPIGTEFSVFLAQWVLSYYEYVFTDVSVVLRRGGPSA